MIAKHAFGRTEHMSSRILFGAAALWDLPQADADAAIELALASGVNHFDTAASYGNAEIYLGNWISRHARPSFLATKTEERTADKAYDSIRRSLERLHVDQVDLIQLHNLVDPTEWQTAMGPGGALEAAIRAREEGLVRFIGVTGHGLTVAAQHTKALERFDFDSVLLPYSYLMWINEQYRSDFLKLFETCKQRNVAVQTIKSLVHTPWGDREHTRNTWYRPLEAQADIDLAVHWVLGNEGLFLNSAGDINILPLVLDAASRFERKPTDAVMQAMVERLEMQSLFAE
ncbi:MAG: aldo/keto reductase [Chloroflexi bacterium HGW-Chloroflexi-4]|nr:MAG: aldo/keto reductase [Chloroflexi bacterium HGW-Chloroflexi-4]